MRTGAVPGPRPRIHVGQVWMMNNSNREDKITALNNAVAAIEKNFGKGSVMKLGDASANINVEAIPTGSISLERGFGCRWSTKRKDY